MSSIVGYLNCAIKRWVQKEMCKIAIFLCVFLYFYEGSQGSRKKSSFLSGPATKTFSPPPLSGPATKKKTFFASSLNNFVDSLPYPVEDLEGRPDLVLSVLRLVLEINFLITLYSVRQSDENSYGGDVVLDSLDIAYRNEDTI